MRIEWNKHRRIRYFLTHKGSKGIKCSAIVFGITFFLQELGLASFAVTTCQWFVWNETSHNSKFSFRKDNCNLTNIPDPPIHQEVVVCKSSINIFIFENWLLGHCQHGRPILTDILALANVDLLTCIFKSQCIKCNNTSFLFCMLLLYKCKCYKFTKLEW